MKKYSYIYIMKKIKLPRKRKKAMIKAKGWMGYTSCQVMNEIMYEENPIKKWTKFPESKSYRNTYITLFNW